jgi:hypothetical protein
VLVVELHGISQHAAAAAVAAATAAVATAVHPSVPGRLIPVQMWVRC